MQFLSFYLTIQAVELSHKICVCVFVYMYFNLSINKKERSHLKACCFHNKKYVFLFHVVILCGIRCFGAIFINYFNAKIYNKKSLFNLFILIVFLFVYKYFLNSSGFRMYFRGDIFVFLYWLQI